MGHLKGLLAENQALFFLKKQGLKLIERNYSTRCGEIDLIMQDGTYLVFIEVRTRKSIQYGGALASVNTVKQQKIIKAASQFLLQNRHFQQAMIRFDVVGYQGMVDKPLWIKNAFET